MDKETVKDFHEELNRLLGILGDKYHFVVSKSHITYSDNGFSCSIVASEVSENIRIRSWDSDEWVEPTLSIYERGVKTCENLEEILENSTVTEDLYED